MGCTSSKLDDLPAVALCRERCTFLDEAIRQRYALANAHVAYIQSLRSVGHTLHSFLIQDFSVGPPSPTLNLPPQRKGDPVSSGKEAAPKGTAHAHSHSNSGSHLHFHSDSDSDDDSGHNSLHHDHSDHSSPLHPHIEYPNTDQQTLGSYQNPFPASYPGGSYPYPGGSYPGQSSYPYPGQSYPYPEQPYPYPPGGYNSTMNYMKKSPTPSVLYQQRPVLSETVQVGEIVDSQISYMKNKAKPSVVYEQRPMNPNTVYTGESSSSSSYSYPYQQTNSGHSYPQPYHGYSNYGGGGGGMGGYYAAPSNYGSQPPPAVASTSKPPPPPPSPPKSSTWDFLNPFESYDKYYAAYTPSRDSKELREEEGIPDLEDEDLQHEVVKEVHGDQKFVGLAGGNYMKGVASEVEEEEERKVEEKEEAASHYQARPSVSEENERMEYEVHVVEKKVVDGEGRSEGRGNAGAFKGGLRDDSEVAKEIEVQFERASESGNEIAKMLEVGKLPYKSKHVSSKVLRIVTPSLAVVSSQPSTSKSSEASSSTAPALLGFDEDIAMRSGNLSSTLQKLLLWEKKLFNEVKAEEKMRVDHDRKRDKLKRLDEKGAEPLKIEATRKLIREMSTRIRIAIQVVDKISATINKIRDEELWPQLTELIQGLTRMWKSMLECHHIQCLAIREARSLGPIGSGKRLSDSHLETTLRLEHELLNWTFRFSGWISAQKGYVRALNSWLLKCLLYEPEDTPDGPVPFSPGRIGAPLVFVICNHWAQALDRISEKEVVSSMRIFAMSVFQLWEHDKLEMRQRMMANKDLERKVRLLEREDQKIQKEIRTLDKKAGDGDMLSMPVYQSNTSNGSIQASLQCIFEAMERFMADSMKAYEDLLQRSEEERVARERVPA